MIEVLKFGDRQRWLAFPRGKSLTQQNMQAETDINQIMRKYEKTGIITHVNQVGGRYGEFHVVPDYQTALNRVKAAQTMFETLPARIRKEFENDAGAFLAFAENPENEEKMRELGLLPSDRTAATPSEGNSSAAEPAEELSPAPAVVPPAE